MEGGRSGLLSPLDEGPSEGPGECLLEIAAVLETRTHTAGLGWRLRAPSGSETIRAETRRLGRTRVFSELAALRLGLEEASRQRCARLVVRLTDPLVERLVRGQLQGRYRRAAAVAAELAPRLARFGSVRFEAGAPTSPELAHAVGEALDAGLHAAAEREEHRALVMEQIIERAKSVHLERSDGGWIANHRYHVQLDPMRCECPAWTARWARAPIAGRRAQRLPCKHLVALALREGITVPADLARLSRRALP